MHACSLAEKSVPTILIRSSASMSNHTNGPFLVLLNPPIITLFCSASQYATKFTESYVLDEYFYAVCCMKPVLVRHSLLLYHKLLIVCIMHDSIYVTRLIPIRSEIHFLSVSSCTT